MAQVYGLSSDLMDLAFKSEAGLIGVGVDRIKGLVMGPRKGQAEDRNHRACPVPCERWNCVCGRWNCACDNPGHAARCGLI